MCSSNTLYYVTLLDDMKWWHIIVMVIVVILCLIGVVLWITVGAVVTNPPDDSKYTSFPFKVLDLILWNKREEYSDNVGKTTPTHMCSYTIMQSDIFYVC